MILMLKEMNFKISIYSPEFHLICNCLYIQLLSIPCIRMRSGLDEQKYGIIQQEAKAISKTFQQRTLEAHQLYLLK